MGWRCDCNGRQRRRRRRRDEQCDGNAIAMDGNRAMGVITIATINRGVMDSGTAVIAPPLTTTASPPPLGSLQPPSAFGCDGAGYSLCRVLYAPYWRGILDVMVWLEINLGDLVRCVSLDHSHPLLLFYYHSPPLCLCFVPNQALMAAATTSR